MKSQFVKALSASAVVLGLMTGSSAWAADLGPYQAYTPPPQVEEYRPPVAIWEGAYIGINGGYAWSNSTFTEPEGGFAGGQLGYNWQRGNVVFGLEGDIQGADLSGRAYNPFADAVAHTDVNWFSTLRGRLGYAFGPVLIYGTGGVAVAEFDNSVRFDDVRFRSSDTNVGYAAGGGIEWAFAPNWSMKAEYLYLGFGDDRIGGFRVNEDFQAVRAGLNYKF
jgi:outer membrane immunogenic protein